MKKKLRKKTANHYKNNFSQNNVRGAIGDIPTEHLLYRILPATWRDYITLTRLDRLTGVWLLLLPCLWGLAVIPTQSIGSLFYYSLVFALGAFAMRSAGCVWNDILDREIDRKVARTKNRPLASGRVSLPSALWLLGGLLLLGFIALVLLLDQMAQNVALLSLMLVVPYPLMKRFFIGPQIWLGLTFNVGVLVAGTLVTDSYFDLRPWWLYLIGILWTLCYDTIYGLQDKEQDELLSLHSTAIWFGDKAKKIIGGFYLTMLLLLFGYFIYIIGNWRVGGFAYILLILIAIVMYDSYRRIIITHRNSSQKIKIMAAKANLNNFRRQWMIGLLILIALLFKS